MNRTRRMLALGIGMVVFGAVAPGGQAAGPDVIVSTVGGAFSENGAVGTLSGYSMETTSCNIGTLRAIWIECTGGSQCNQHPVIAQNLYRLRTVAGSTRFEQLGMSWVKHGFCAADSTLCGNCASEPSCDWLGLQCSDTYSSFLNGSQPGLGPRSEINAYTGVFAYPYVLNWNLAGNATYKRLQVATADVDPAQNVGATWLGESHYVTTDESPAERFNNASWRQVTVGSFNGGIWNLSFSGSTHAQQAAIEAWPTLDPDAKVTDAYVSGEGRFILGYKVTDLGGGVWHYEYALYNMNSDRAASMFRVPVGDGLAVSNVEFHDVNYHSGEPYDGTDWGGVHAAGNVTWITPSPGGVAAANRNALRWSTMYNFRFDCNAPPIAGDVTIGLFKAGTPASLTVSVKVPESIPPGCDCINDGGCDGGICTMQRCIDCLCASQPNIYGDANHDGTVDIFDIECVLGAFAGDYSKCDLLSTDIIPCPSGDGFVDVFDILGDLDAFAGSTGCCP
ncbi:MAG: hypothetical protein HOP29_17910 [Phycisphaerales bacterium]|nr:hypothetical protein [Phycisphaerales bacterium]